jgi:hypothetical protein
MFKIASSNSIHKNKYVYVKYIYRMYIIIKKYIQSKTNKMFISVMITASIRRHGAHCPVHVQYNTQISYTHTIIHKYDHIDTRTERKNENSNCRLRYTYYYTYYENTLLLLLLLLLI